MIIHIWSDIVCPWCYVGKRRFERGLERFPHRERVEVVYRSFQLNPDAPAGETSDRQEMLRRKYRLTEDQVDALDVRMVEAAKAEGLQYNLKGTRTGNTLDAHRLLHLALDEQKQNAALERLYRAYFTEQRSIFDRESLAALGVEAGLNPVRTRETLESDRYAERVALDLAQARGIGIGGVPFFVIDGKYGVSGAQPPDVFADALRRAWSDRTAN
ncbi:MAG TPA: DsbA family oxidoreductase [Vicinamibacterales bacterium]|nr:DsbA family oxidoreductase [Vicinamibacterales bacterium]